MPMCCRKVTQVGHYTTKAMCTAFGLALSYLIMVLLMGVDVSGYTIPREVDR